MVALIESGSESYPVIFSYVGLSSHAIANGLAWDERPVSASEQSNQVYPAVAHIL